MNQPNKDYIIQSLRNQLANASMQIAERDAVMTEQHQQIEELKQELEVSKEIEEMNSAE